MVKVQFAYCDFCKKEVEHPVKKPLDTMQKTVWGMVVLATLGFGIIAYLIYNYYLRKKVYCPTCHSKLRFSDKPFEKPKEVEVMEKGTPREKVMAKVKAKQRTTSQRTSSKERTEKKEEKKSKSAKGEGKKIYCTFCGNELEPDTATCPYCGTVLKF